MKKIAVIISVYNCEEYIDECLNSLENQSLRQDKIQVVIINDGSKDESLSKIQKYTNKHKNWTLISRENRGLAVSRNEGLDILDSEYVTFLDSDDYLNSDALEKMYNEIKQNNAEIGIFRTKRFNSKYVKEDEYRDKLNDFDTIVNIDSEKRLPSIVRSVAILYSKDIVNDIRFIPNVIHEDNYFCIKAYSKADRIYISKTCVYMIREREGENTSITQNLNIKTYKDMYKNILKADLEIKIQNIVKIHANQLYAYCMKNIKFEERHEGFSILREYINQMYANKVVSYGYYLYVKIYINLKKMCHIFSNKFMK